MTRLIEHIIVAALVAAFVVSPMAQAFIERADAAQASNQNGAGTGVDPGSVEEASRDNSGTKGVPENDRAPQLTVFQGVAEHGSLGTERRGFSDRLPSYPAYSW